MQDFMFLSFLCRCGYCFCCQGHSWQCVQWFIYAVFKALFNWRYNKSMLILQVHINDWPFLWENLFSELWVLCSGYLLGNLMPSLQLFFQVRNDCFFTTCTLLGHNNIIVIHYLCLFQMAQYVARIQMQFVHRGLELGLEQLKA